MNACSILCVRVFCAAGNVLCSVSPVFRCELLHKWKGEIISHICTIYICLPLRSASFFFVLQSLCTYTVKWILLFLYNHFFEKHFIKFSINCKYYEINVLGFFFNLEVLDLGNWIFIYPECSLSIKGFIWLTTFSISWNKVMFRYVSHYLYMFLHYVISNAEMNC